MRTEMLLNSEHHISTNELPLSFCKALLEAIPGSVFIMDARGHLVGWNN
jgi:hypothetical protein